MTPEFAYFLKVNVALALFYAFYRLFFYKDTFFHLRRYMLLSFFGLSLLYPLLNIQEWVREQAPIAEVIHVYSAFMLPEASVTAHQTTFDWSSLLVAGYLSGVGVLFVRFLLQLVRLLWMAYTSERSFLKNTPVRLLRKSTGPFSFFQLIFLHPDSHSDKEISEILTHECTHVSQWHSVDVLICEFMNMICWCNPFIWLLNREVRYNLEYMADNTVIQLGYDSKTYQYHLLGLAHHQAAAALYNNFSVLHLKNRIRMMNKKRTRSIGKTKYLMFIPLAVALMLLSNIEAVARITGKLTTQATSPAGVVKKKAKVVDPDGKPLMAVSVTVKDSNSGTMTDKEGYFELDVQEDATLFLSCPGWQSRTVEAKFIFDNMKLQMIPENRYSKGKAFTVVEHMPVYPGGTEELLKFITTSIRYPKDAKEQKRQGRVICAFVVAEDGTIHDAEVLRGVFPSLDAEALRVINMMPAWAPGRNGNRAVAVKYTVPIAFNLGVKEGVTSDNAAPNTLQPALADGSNPANPTYRVVDEMPRYPGGDEALLKFIAKSVKYPKDAQDAGVQGRVICSFVVEKDGTVSDTQILRGVSPSLDAEAVRVISSFDKWTPGKQDGKPVRVLYTVPITFRVQ